MRFVLTMKNIRRYASYEWEKKRENERKNERN